MKKYPIEYELDPKEVDSGTHWLTLKLKNISNKTIKNLDIQLNSNYTKNLQVFGTGKYIADLKPKEEEVVPFQVIASGSTSVDVNIKGRRDGDLFNWTSPWIQVKVMDQVAELEKVYVLSHPYTTLGKTLEVEATIKSLVKNDGIDLEFWADTPSMDFEELAEIKTKELAAGEEVRYSAEITPKETGEYTIYSYLYDDGREIDRKTNSIWVQKA
jgi:uncharacterized membrane protein